MRIGIDIRAIGKKRTGDETYTLGLVRNLLRIDNKNQYFLYIDKSGTEDIKKIEKLLGVVSQNVSLISVLPSKKMFWTFFLLPRQAKKDQLDILHVQYIAPQILDKRIVLITTVHDISFERFPKYIEKKDLFFLKLLIPLSLRKADGIIAVSNFTRNEIMGCYNTSHKKIVAIDNGCEIQIFKGDISENEKRIFRDKHDIKKPFLLYVGTLQPRKNIPFLIEGFVKLKKNHSDDEKIKNVQLIIGGTCYGKNYDVQIDEVMNEIDDRNIKNDIRFIGYIKSSELPKFYYCAMAYVNASLYEGFGLPIIEAMASKTPVICSDNSCFGEIAGDAAEIFKNNNKNSFVSSVLNVMTDENRKNELIARGSQRANKYSWKKTAMQTLEFYDTIYLRKMRR